MDTITFLTDTESWITPELRSFTRVLESLGHNTRVLNSPDQNIYGGYCFLLSYSKILSEAELKNYDDTLVVHESDLPAGRGWSPLSWQILEGRDEVVFTLFRASSKVDSGAIIAKRIVEFDGTELSSEWRKTQALVSFDLIREYIQTSKENRRVLPNDTLMPGFTPAYYRRRTPMDSELNLKTSLGSQFNLLRVVDNDRYPAFFKYLGHTYLLKVYKR